MKNDTHFISSKITLILEILSRTWQNLKLTIFENLHPVWILLTSTDLILSWGRIFAEEKCQVLGKAEFLISPNVNRSFEIVFRHKIILNDMK